MVNDQHSLYDQGIDDILPDLDERFVLEYWIEDEKVETIEAPTKEMLEEKLNRLDTAKTQYVAELINDKYEVDDLT